jgi:hypothetical protein
MKAFKSYIVINKTHELFYNATREQIVEDPRDATVFKTIKLAHKAFSAFISYTEDQAEKDNYSRTFGYQMVKTVPINRNIKFVE